MSLGSSRKLEVKNLPKKFLLTDPAKLLLYPLIKKVFPYTQLHFGGLCQMYDIVRDLNQRQIEGALVELGCGRGGCGAFVARVSADRGDKRPIWLFDSFEGLSEPTTEDTVGTIKVIEKVQKGYLKVSPESVNEVVMKVAPSERERVHVVEGWFDTTVPEKRDAIGDIAILRLDADLYEPTLFGLRELYDRVVHGGYIVIDDYRNWIGARKAVFEFFCERNISPYLQEYPGRGVAYFIKS
jgi:O-methyltransferase